MTPKIHKNPTPYLQKPQKTTKIHKHSEFHYFSELLDSVFIVILSEAKNPEISPFGKGDGEPANQGDTFPSRSSFRANARNPLHITPIDFSLQLKRHTTKNSLFHRKCEKICKIKNSDYNYKNSLIHRICEFHYFSELLDNKVDKNAIASMNRVTASYQGKMTYSESIFCYFVKKSQ